MNKDLAEVSAVWRALFWGGAGSPILLLVVFLSPLFQRAAENGFAADDGRCVPLVSLVADNRRGAPSYWPTGEDLHRSQLSATPSVSNQ